MKLFVSKNKHPEPLEIKRDVLQEIDNEIVSVGGGQRTFPHSGVEIRLYASDETAKSKYSASLIENSLLEKSVCDYLQPPRCVEAKPFIKIAIEDKPPHIAEKQTFHIVYTDATKIVSVDTEGQLEVLVGLANVKKLRLIHQKTYIGRCRDTLRKDGKISRKNDLYFLDRREFTGKIPKELKSREEINNSVSRLHAHLEFDDKSGNYYLFDNGSSKGTTILRGGRGEGENVDRNAGKILGDGDVINLGKAQIRFNLLVKKSK